MRIILKAAIYLVETSIPAIKTLLFEHYRVLDQRIWPKTETGTSKPETPYADVDVAAKIIL